MRATVKGTRTLLGRPSAPRALAGLFVLAGGLFFGQASCSSTPESIAVRTFDRPEQLAVVCMKVLDDFGNAIPAEPVTQSNCAPVPSGVDGRYLQFHLYALVTQTTRGEIGVVDLTGGFVVDEDRSTPGINFIPVGGVPRDVTVATDGQLTFVTSAEPNKSAIYAIPNARILGDSQGLTEAQQADRPLLNLPQLPACQLPQAPGAIAVIPRPRADDPLAYELVVVLTGSGRTPPKLVTIDPAAFRRGAGLSAADGGVEDAGAGDGGGADGGTTFTPGALPSCADAVTSAIEISPAVPAEWTPGPTWSDGLVYVDGGVNAVAPFAEGDGLPIPPTPDAGTASDAAIPIDSHLLDAPRPTSIAFDSAAQVLYVGDSARPIIHVFDVATPSAPKELAPLAATSALNAARVVQVGPMSVSPTTSDFKRYLYALDQQDGSIMVFDATDPRAATTPRVPLQRPHAEINPLAPPDRIVFSDPVKSVTFVRHDWPLTHRGDPSVLENKLPAALTGVLCNPTPKVVDNGSGIFVVAPGVETGPGAEAAMNGAYYRAGTGNQQVDLDPKRLRGIFGFAVLSSGMLEAIDVDDWDAPCRRPDPMGVADTGSAPAPDKPAPSALWQLSSLQVPQPNPGPGDFDPYHVPLAIPNSTSASPVTNESFFPVSMPHRARSNYFLRRDPTTGTHIPNLRSNPQLTLEGANRPTAGAGSETSPKMMPTLLPGLPTVKSDPTFLSNPTEPWPANRNISPAFINVLGADDAQAKKSLSFPNSGAGPGIRIAWEDPTVHTAEDWTVTYEGPLPGFDGVIGNLDTNDDLTLTLRSDSALFCRLGVEDLAFGQRRIDEQAPEYARLGLPAPDPAASPKQWTADYIQIIDDVLPVDDPYWQDNTDSDRWAFPAGTFTDPTARHDMCAGAFGDQASANTHLQRDLPILEAYEDHLLLGRFDGGTTLNRVVVGADPKNVPFLKQIRACFHNQVRFNVRTGGEWVTRGSKSGYLHHVISDAAGRCVQSNVPREQLLNSRVPDLVAPTGDELAAAVPPTRYSPLAMRNPMFSFVIWRGGAAAGADPSDHTTTQRDLVYAFTTQGDFVPLSLNLSPTSTVINPVSVVFIESLGQIAVIDGAQQGQGLILVDLNTIDFAHSPYF